MSSDSTGLSLSVSEPQVSTGQIEGSSAGINIRGDSDFARTVKCLTTPVMTNVPGAGLTLRFGHGTSSETSACDVRAQKHIVAVVM